MTSIPAARRLRIEAFQVSRWARQSPFCFLMSSETGRLSTTSQLRPEAAPSRITPISRWRRAISSGVQSAPVGM